jgi:glycerophosphoryl diester phosphodiesterase
MISTCFDLQGHRGAGGLKPENTLPSFETALDLGVTSIETDVHITRDGVPVLIHDPCLSTRMYRRLSGGTAAEVDHEIFVRDLTLLQLRAYAADRNPDPQRFPRQNDAIGPLAAMYAEHFGIHPFTPPSLADLFGFAEAYTGEWGRLAGKTIDQQKRARTIRFDLELKRVPFHPEFVGETFNSEMPGLLEEVVVAAVRSAAMVVRTTVRSFDHRSVLAVRKLEPGLTGAVLVDRAVPISPAQWVREADAGIYCPQFEFLDRNLIRRVHDQGIRIVPWTVNNPDDWIRLLDWGIDGLTTDYPDRLGELLSEREVHY